jgi:hypothetical protein
MMLEGERSIGLLDLIAGGVVSDAEHIVVVSFRHVFRPWSTDVTPHP